MRFITYSPQLRSFSTRGSSLRDLFSSVDLQRQILGTNQHSWVPPLDIQENADQLVVHLEAAGLQKDGIEITLHDENLTISGKREIAAKEGDAVVHKERVAGSFSRTVALPSAVKSDAVTATYTDGVLAVVLPKAEEAKPRRIDVTVS
jgi:HSP20 family protein